MGLFRKDPEKELAEAFRVYRLFVQSVGAWLFGPVMVSFRGQTMREKFPDAVAYTSQKWAANRELFLLNSSRALLDARLPGAAELLAEGLLRHIETTGVPGGWNPSLDDIRAQLRSANRA